MMKQSLVLRWLMACLLWSVALSTLAAAKPNIIFILADDLGYGDIGAFGQKKIHTPNLDRLAAEGMKFTQHYSGNAVCAPSRCVLLSGKHPGHAFIRNNREVKPEGQFPIPADLVTLPKLLKKAGYINGTFGKWGLGAPDSEGAPLKQGLDRFYGYNCQRVAHNYYPTSLWDNAQRVVLNNPAFAAHQKLPAGVDPKDANNYKPYLGKDYSPDLIAEQARQFVKANRSTPFFLYWTTTVPHLALQVPEDSLQEYLGKFPETPYTGTSGYLPHYAPRAAYAAMITRLDREIGRMMDLVKELGLEDHTLFVFTSDNGPLYDQLGGTDADFFESAGPLNGRKGSLYEGGVRVPLLVRWKGRIAAGSASDRVTGFEDWLPTLLEFVGVPELTPGEVDGISFVPTLLGRAQEPRPFLYREFPGYGGQQSVRIGDWKGVRQALVPKGKAGSANLKIELYNLKEDLAEKNDVAAQHPEMVAKMEALMRAQHTPSAEFPFAALDRLGK
ncbi:MAG: arylsulfatase [Verrucomicrobiota bacterium]